LKILSIPGSDKENFGQKILFFEYFREQNQNVLFQLSTASNHRSPIIIPFGAYCTGTARLMQACTNISNFNCSY